MTPPLGLHADIPEAEYHADKGSLSVSGAKRLLPPNCPAIFKWERDNGRPAKDTFDFGHAAHGLILGSGAPLVVVDAPDWRTKAAQEQKKEAHAAGHVPILTEQWLQVQGMAKAITAHPIASALLHPDHGKPEQSFYFPDTQTGVIRRGRWDWLPDTDGGRLIIPDFKTSISSEPAAFAKAAANFGYASQASWYMDGARALELADDIAFVFIVAEKTAPYVVTVIELDAAAIEYGARRNRQAIDLYAKCVAEDYWPGYAEDVALVSLPRWATREEGVEQW